MGHFLVISKGQADSEIVAMTGPAKGHIINMSRMADGGYKYNVF